MSYKRRSVMTFGLIFALLTLMGCNIIKNSPQGTPTASQSSGENPKKVTIGIQVSPAMTLVMVAKDKGLFTKEGVDVELKEFTAGKFALQAFLSGSIDFAVSGEVPVALATLQGNPIRVVTQVVERTSDEVRVVALKEGNLTNPTEYFKAKKRKLATSIGGGPEFYTHEFLKYYKISPKDVEIISQKPEDMPVSLASNSVDAISIFDPFAFIAEKKLGNKATTFTNSELYSELYVLNARPSEIEQQASSIKAILRALVQSSEFIEKNPDEAKSVLQKYTKLDKDIIDGVWKNFTFRPALTQRLIDYWNAQADWAIAAGKTPKGTQKPNFRSVIESKFLKEIKPDAVQTN